MQDQQEPTREWYEKRCAWYANELTRLQAEIEGHKADNTRLKLFYDGLQQEHDDDTARIASRDEDIASWQARVDRLTAALRAVHDTFVKDEAQGYQSRDRQFAIEILGAALAPADPEPKP